MSLGAFHPRLLPAELLFRAVPPLVAGRLRTLTLRACGVRMGHASGFWGMPRFVGTGPILSRLSIGAHCGFNQGCFFELEDRITIGDHVAVGHDVMFLTTTRGSRAPIVIEDGVWLGARCTILPGVTIGAGAVIGASVVVSTSVAPNMLVMGAQKVSLAKWRAS